MYGAEAVHHGGRVNAHDATRPEASLDDVQRALIVGMAEDWNNNGVIADIEIRVACRQARVAVADVARHGNRNDIRDEASKAVVIVF